MMTKINNKEFADYLRSLVKNNKRDVKEYYQLLKNDSEKPYVLHKKANQITVVLKGEGKAFIDNKTYDIFEDDILLMTNNTRHSFICESGEMELFHIHVPNAEILIDRYIIREDYRELQSMQGKEENKHEGE